MPFTNPEIDKYIQALTTGEDPVLAELNRFTYLKVAHPQMISGPVQGKLLEMLSRMLKPSRILEIGTFTGYSSICLARGLKKDGRLITIDINDELREQALIFFKKAGLEEKIQIINGDAVKIIGSLDEQFDLVFLDAEKEQYIDYYELSMVKLKPGGFILADNTLWDGKVTGENPKMDSATRAIIDFNHHVHNDNRVENVILPLRDGLTIIRKKLPIA